MSVGIALGHLRIWGCDGLSASLHSIFWGKVGSDPLVLELEEHRNEGLLRSSGLSIRALGVYARQAPDGEHYLVNWLWASLCPLHPVFTWGERPGLFPGGDKDGSSWSRITLLRQQSCAQFSSYFGTKYTVSRETSFPPPPLHYAGYYNKIFPDAQLQ